MTPADLTDLVVGAVQGLASSTLFVLVLLVGFCVVLGFLKLRSSGRDTLTVRSLDELVGTRATFLRPDAPRGPVDQLRTPELLEAAARKGQTG